MDYQELGKELGKMVEEKQEAYGDSFGKSGRVLREMYPNGVSPEQYDDALTIVRIIDKLFRIATKKDAFGESPYRDIVGYGLLGVRRDEGENEKHNIQDTSNKEQFKNEKLTLKCNDTSEKIQIGQKEYFKGLFV